MRKFKCCLRGAYGPGNFGDDLLMISALKILESVYNKDEICVTVYDIEMAKNFLPNVNFVPFSSPVSSHITFLGGGGQYFSFHGVKTKKTSVFRKINDHIKSGMSFSDMLWGAYIRKKFNRRWLSKYDIGFCLGIGPFINRDARLYKLAVEELPKMSYLSLRDNDSFLLSSELGVNNIKEFSDPIFLKDLWLEGCSSLSENSNEESRDLVVIVRDWPFDLNKVEQIKKLQVLKSVSEKRGLNLKFISLYQSYDKEIVDYFNAIDIKVICWNPLETSLKDFLGILSNCKALITTRAHGAIVPAVLGVPPIIINIEKKLEKVHKMLGSSSLLYQMDHLGSEANWHQILDSYEENKQSLKDNLIEDIRLNRNKAEMAVNDVIEFMRSIAK
ncbi:polysaccharide pyruvyl transferase family protein [Aeromonas caviae]|uniref:polysaccharide pyruvyl transferase family protein n=1 Tax=Aeromonas caviae TaxID=648 RepID=UPI003EC6DD32